MSDGKGDGQLSFPQERLPMHSSSESQSPWFRSHLSDDVQHVYLSSLMALQVGAEKSIYSLLLCAFCMMKWFKSQRTQPKRVYWYLVSHISSIDFNLLARR